MSQVLVLLGTFAVVYAALRSEGGSGLTIKFTIPSYSTKAGRRMRLKLISLLVLIIGALGFVAVSESGNKSLESVFVFSVLVGAILAFLYRKE